MNESAIGTGVTTESVGGANQAAASPTASQSSGAPSEQSQGSVTAPVQGETQTQQPDDPLAGFPSDDELKAAVANKTPFAEQAARIKGVYEPLKSQFTELQGKFRPFEPVAERFEQPEQLQEVLSVFDGLTQWQRDAASGELVPATERGAQLLAEKFPQHADFLAADLLNMETVDPESGRRLPRIDLALEGIAKDPERRAKALQILGAVEPSSISPQWQPSDEELAVVRDDLKDTYKKLPYEDREELKLASPEFINKTLADRKLMDELRQEREQNQQERQQQLQQREQYIAQQANQAGEQYVGKLMTDALATFHNSVVEQCNFLQPLDPASLPQGMTAEQAAQVNQQIADSNKAEAAQITLAVIGVINEETRPFVLPLLKQIGVIDDKMLESLDKAAQGFGDNARNYGHLSFRGQLGANGQGYRPGQDVVTLNNEAQRNLKLLVHHANQIKGRLMEKRSQFFGMKAQGHNQTLNSVAASRPAPNGSAFNPATATTQQPTRWPTRQEIEAQYGS
jgi:hypothetical protein